MDSSRDTGTPAGPRSRTMRLLREAARELLRTGGPLTVPAAAGLAGVSRATAYRYFPNNDSVVLHATMSLADNPLEDADWTSGAVASPDELGARAADLVPRRQRGLSTTRPSCARCCASRSRPNENK